MKQTENNNILIARFMGLINENHDLGDGDFLGGWYLNNQDDEDLQYNENWNLLMPVIDKISNTVIKGHAPFNSDQFVRVEIVPGGYVKISELRDTPIFKNVSFEKSLINAVYGAAVDFIKWHNQQKHD